MLQHTFEKSQQPARVVILGKNGFLAKALIQRLAAEGISYAAFGQADIDLTADGAAEKLSAEIKPSDAVVMFSTLTPDKGRDMGTFMKNVRMAESVCNAVSKSPCGHFIYISSDAVYKGTEPLIDEGSCREPLDLYGLMHLTREMLFADVLGKTKTPLCVFRPTAVLGAGDTHNSYGPNRFIRTALQEGKIKLFGGGEEKRHHVFAGDFIEVIVLALLHKSVGAVNVAGGEAVSFGDLAKLIVKHCSKPVEVENLPRSNNVITHRIYSRENFAKSFPSFQYTPLEVAVEKSLSELLHG